MPTNEERREIAKSIRKIARRGFLGITYFSSLSIESLFNLEVEGSFLGVNYYTKSSAMRMADLIEPEPERTCKFVHHECRHPGEKDPCGKYQDCEWSCAKDSLYCSSCDKCVAVSFAEHLKVKKYSFCPYCDDKVVNDDNQ